MLDSQVKCQSSRGVVVGRRLVLLIGICLVSSARVCSEETYAAPQLLWRFMTGSRIPQRVAVGHDGIVYAASNDKNLYALYPDGTLKWQYELSGRPATVPVLGYDGSIYLGVWPGTFCSLAPNGALRWSYQTGAQSIVGNPAVGVNGDLYLCGDQGRVYALSYSGKPIWSRQLQREIVTDVSIGGDGTVFVGTDDRRLNALRPDGVKRWDMLLSGIPGSAAIGDDATVYVGAFGLHAVSPEGSPLWSYVVPEEISDPVLGRNGIVVVGTRRGKLYTIDRSGEKVWDVNLGSPIVHSPVLTEDGTVIVAAGRDLYAVSPAGVVEWRFRVTRDFGPPLVDRGGTIYVGADDWMVYALAGGHGGLARSSWPVSGHDTANTGRVSGLRDLRGPAYEILRAKLYSDETEMKSLALQEIEQYLKGERYLGVYVQDLELLLDYAVFEGLKYRSQHFAPNLGSMPSIRLKSCALLGSLATEEAKRTLLAVVSEEQDVTIRTHAVEAIGRIGHDRDGVAARVFERSLTSRPEDEQLAVAVVGALGRISEHDGGLYEDAAFRSLVRIVRGVYRPSVRQQAAQVLRAVLAAIAERDAGGVELQVREGAMR